MALCTRLQRRRRRQPRGATGEQLCYSRVCGLSRLTVVQRCDDPAPKGRERGCGGGYCSGCCDGHDHVRSLHILTSPTNNSFLSAETHKPHRRPPSTPYPFHPSHFLCLTRRSVARQLPLSLIQRLNPYPHALWGSLTSSTRWTPSPC